MIRPIRNGLHYLLLLTFAVLISACNKDEKIFEENQQQIRQYLADNNLQAQQTETGLHYIVTKEGDGDFPNAQSKVKVNYKGYLTNKTVFDDGQNVELPLAQVIKGWQEGIPKFSRGGSGYLFIPSSLGYGSSATGKIPANAVLIFEIDLIDFNE